MKMEERSWLTKRIMGILEPLVLPVKKKAKEGEKRIKGKVEVYYYHHCHHH
jgi:hypothetical protein